MEEDVVAAPLAPVATLPWPEAMPAQAASVRGVLHGVSAPLSAAQVAAAFGGPAGKRAARMAEQLEMIAALGQAVAMEDGRYASG